MGKWVEMVGIIKCPVCGLVGELKKYRPTLKHKDKYYYRIDHFRNEEIPEYGEFRGKYAGCCYIGKKLPETVIFMR